MKNLVIVESPSKSKTIEKYLGEDFEVVSSKGHIRDLATRGKGGLGVDVENEFKPTYVISKDKVDVVKSLKQRAKKSAEVYLATDPDREGEAISWHLADELGLDITKTNRVVFNEITKTAVLEAFNNPRKIDMDLVHSQETRRILDRIIGFKLSKLLNTKIRSKSAGRVQSVALKLIVEREREIMAFITEEYWTVHAGFIKDEVEFEAILEKIDGKKAALVNNEQVQEVLNRLSDGYSIKSVKEQTRNKDAKLPFITSTLQQEAANKLSFSAKKTMRVAQRLYEGVALSGDQEGIITYMRTDSTRLSAGFRESAKQLILDKYGAKYNGFYRVKNDENSQDAHEAIRPTHIEYSPEDIKSYLTSDEYKLYKLIYSRALASLMSPAVTDVVSVIVTQDNLDFAATGTHLKFDGYLRVYGDYESSKDRMMPLLSEGKNLQSTSLEGKQHFTEPPLRYSEARLIKAMEEKGIGRPSTYASIIDTLQTRAYVMLEKQTATQKTKVFVPTPQGMLTDEQLAAHFATIINVGYTADMENELDEIAEGQRDSVESLKNFYDNFSPLVDQAYEKMEKKELEKTGELCPDCGGELVIRNGRFGPFVSCMNFPTCKYTGKLNAGEKKEPEYTGENCPLCNSRLVKRKSRYGRAFIGCSSYPKCRYIQKTEKSAEETAEKPLEEAVSKE